MADPPTTAAPSGLSPDERRLVEALRNRDEDAFAELIDRYHESLVRLAMMYVASRAVAEDVAQEAWVGVLRGIDGFQGRSSLRTWIYRILVNTAKTRGVREARSVPFASLGGDGEPAVDPDRFLPVDDRDRPGGWLSPPTDWDGISTSPCLPRTSFAPSPRNPKRLSHVRNGFGISAGHSRSVTLKPSSVATSY